MRPRQESNLESLENSGDLEPKSSALAIRPRGRWKFPREKRFMSPAWHHGGVVDMFVGCAVAVGIMSEG